MKKTIVLIQTANTVIKVLIFSFNNCSVLLFNFAAFPESLKMTSTSLKVNKGNPAKIIVHEESSSGAKFQ